MPYNQKEYQDSNVKYTNKDFAGLKNTLVEYAKTYFPNTYRDFNETSPGMMLIEMSAYVGDVLSFYIDQQYQEMMLPLAQERRNIINVANMLGYKVKPTSAAHVNLDVSIEVDATGDINNLTPNWNQAVIIDEGMQVQSSAESTVLFETTDIIDFTVSSSSDPTTVEVSTTNDDGLVNTYKLTKKVQAISAETLTQDFNIGSPKQYLKLTLPEDNVIDIISCKDSNGNEWYEVDYLAQDRIPESIFYHGDDRRSGENTGNSAYVGLDDTTVENIPVPYTLQYKKVSKRFITEINSDNTTSLVFGNGLLRTGATGSLQQGFFQSEQAGYTIPGEVQNTFDTPVNPVDGGVATSLGETPSNTTLTITYRVGGGIKSNIPQGDLISVVQHTKISAGTQDGGTTPTCINNTSARGGNSAETVEEIRHRSKAFFSAQNRCVTKADYESRALSMPSKFGNIAKVYCTRFSPFQRVLSSLDVNGDGTVSAADYNTLMDTETGLFTQLEEAMITAATTDGTTEASIMTDISDQIKDVYAGLENLFSMEYTNDAGVTISPNYYTPPSIEIYLLSYDNNNNLSLSPSLIKQNLKEYLKEFRMVTDEVALYNGFIINFGVAFEVVAHKYANKAEVKLRCIDVIRDYFNIKQMQFRQPIFTNDLSYQLMDVDGVRSVNFVEITQGPGSVNSDLDVPPLYNSSGVTFPSLFDSTISEGVVTTGQGSSGYGHMYDFKQFYDGRTSSDGVILPSKEPAVFELKNPNQNIKGVVR